MKVLLCLLPFLLLFTACPLREDTCFPLGDTFTDVAFAPAPPGRLALSLQTLDTLPPAYFAEATLLRLDRDQDGNAFTNLAAESTITLATADSLVISLPVAAAAAAEVGLAVRYPDRQDFVACQHPGSGDQYVLFLFFRYEVDGVVADFRWVEDFRAGGF